MEKQIRKMYSTKELMPGLFSISSCAVKCFLVVGKTGAMLVDTSYGFEDISQVVRSITSLPVTVVNSHGHVDHSGGNFFFDTPTYIHEADVPVYQLHNTPWMHRYMEKTLAVFQKIVFWRNILPKDPERNDEKRASFSNFRYMKEGDSFDLGGITARIIEIPGHTTGSIAVYLPEKRLVITSDGANTGTWLLLPESANLSTYLQSLRKLEKLDVDYILTGHVNTLFPKSALQEWIKVAEYPDVANAKEEKGGDFAPGVKPIRVWAVGDTKKKGPSILIDPEKL